MKRISKSLPDGTKVLQKSGDLLEVVEFLGEDDFKVKFEDSPVFTTKIGNIKRGSVYNKNKPSVCGIGYYGWGEFKTKINGKRTPSYEVWRGIIRRCYEKENETFRSYWSKGVEVCEEWLNFQVFSQWYYDQLEYLPEGKYDVDKDLFGDGKLYSPETCVLLPSKLNHYITNRKTCNVGYVKKGKNKITTTVSLLGRQIFIGDFEDQGNANKYYTVCRNYIDKTLSYEYMILGMISEKTRDKICSVDNPYSEEDELYLFDKKPSLKVRIDGLIFNKTNLFERCKHKISSEIYKDVSFMNCYSKRGALE
ncbi:HNH endonuclease [Vibrio phage qdvp001]|uniref:HNH endonuclease n=1 Tax=Vibrio phage qdvp001 TaxID=1003177 RepID=UPI00071F3341|nr:HNH endonuclease [Vibrio phage qdvp001]ALM62103.1 hypothetical protein qdvp001_111 [Vibrio phage qdvp001]